MKPWVAWHAIYNLDGSFRGYEGAEINEDGTIQPSKVYAQERRDEHGEPLPDPSRNLPLDKSGATP